MGQCFFFGLCHNKTGGKIIFVEVNFLMGGNAFEFFNLPIVGSKIKILVEPSVTYHFYKNYFFPQFCYDINQKKHQPICFFLLQILLFSTLLLDISKHDTRNTGRICEFQIFSNTLKAKDKLVLKCSKSKWPKNCSFLQKLSRKILETLYMGTLYINTTRQRSIQQLCIQEHPSPQSYCDLKSLNKSRNSQFWFINYHWFCISTLSDIKMII